MYWRCCHDADDATHCGIGDYFFFFFIRRSFLKKTAGTWQIPLALEQLKDPIFCRLYPHFLLGNLPALPFCLSVCSFLYFFLRLCRRFCFCLSPPLMSKRIKKEKATGSYLLVPVSAPFCLSIDQVREKDNAILLFVCCSNKCRRVAMLGPNFVSFSLFLISLWWLEWKSLSGCAKRQWTEREFSFGAIESHDVVWLFVYSGRSLAVPSRFVISSIHPIDSRNYRQTYTYHLDI